MQQPLPLRIEELVVNITHTITTPADQTILDECKNAAHVFFRALHLNPTEPTPHGSYQYSGSIINSQFDEQALLQSIATAAGTATGVRVTVHINRVYQF